MNEIVPAHTIGDYVPLVDGPEKVSGRAKYTADFVGLGMLAGRIFRSPYSHAEILEVDISEAAKLPGVKAIVTGADCDKGFGVLPIARTEYPLARERVRYCGEPIAAVAAVDEQTAKAAPTSPSSKKTSRSMFFGRCLCKSTASGAIAACAVT